MPRGCFRSVYAQFITDKLGTTHIARDDLQVEKGDHIVFEVA